jgi:hypothetical protein
MAEEGCGCVRNVPAPAAGGKIDLEQAGYAVAALIPAALVYSREAPDAFAVAGVLALGLAAYRAGTLKAAIRSGLNALASPAALAALGLLMVLAASLAWSLAPARGAEHLAHMTGVGALAILGVSLALRGAQRPYPRGLALALSLAAILVTVEHATGAVVRDLVGIRTDAHQLNRAAVGIALFLPLVVALLARDRRWLLAALVTVVAYVAVLRLASESAKLALLVIPVVGVAALLAPRPARSAIAIAAAAGTLAMPFLAGNIASNIPEAVHRAVGPSSIQIRAEISDAFARHGWERPFFGHGAEASSAFVQATDPGILSEHEAFLLGLGHPHNAPLQIFFELGFLGTAVAAVALFLAIRALPSRGRVADAGVLATVAGFLAVWAVSHGVWQSWFYSIGALVAILFAAAYRQATPAASSSREPPIRT